eukprot:CAMPEP_0178907212 /NCGR_PEP_ID=MMETSP0786-20121207/7245_1 /TAXON_ID=186022 /ORGANISM="Thalassionema frauenfeldii, Strain CCMP 1798" /LENGTH=203 /DNA_ID=CAMNT_0020578985 /DNA_START=71 /DNA_END=685 /DNA_ORIENTATION=+
MFLSSTHTILAFLIAFAKNLEGLSPSMSKHKTRVSLKIAAKEGATAEWFSFAATEKKRANAKGDEWIAESFNKVKGRINPQEPMHEDPSKNTEWFSFGLANANVVETSKLSKATKNNDKTGSEWFSVASHQYAEKKEQVDSDAWIAEQFNKVNKKKEGLETNRTEWFSFASQEGARAKPTQKSSFLIVKPTDKVEWFSFASQQ